MQLRNFEVNFTFRLDVGPGDADMATVVATEIAVPWELTSRSGRLSVPATPLVLALNPATAGDSIGHWIRKPAV